MLFNENKKKIIINQIRNAGSFWKKFKGLMFEKPENFNYGLVFELPEENRLLGSIHMLFVFFAIDVVYLDKNKRVVEIKRKLLPFSLNYTPRKNPKYFIELPAGKSDGIGLGDKLDWS